ncbi:unnamed protein product [Mesocestoides corti]|uniref:Uncharacterized protein n=2 Tax=Mesocestoides corti TaxID=53468 RepID=A0A0R3U8G2_MESCO|nr:unnamed protein product [Mesocestoides corti]
MAKQLPSIPGNQRLVSEEDNAAIALNLRSVSGQRSPNAFKLVTTSGGDDGNAAKDVAQAGHLDDVQGSGDEHDGISSVAASAFEVDGGVPLPIITLPEVPHSGCLPILLACLVLSNRSLFVMGHPSLSSNICVQRRDPTAATPSLTFANPTYTMRCSNYCLLEIPNCFIVGTHWFFLIMNVKPAFRTARPPALAQNWCCFFESRQITQLLRHFDPTRVMQFCPVYNLCELHHPPLRNWWQKRPPPHRQ